MLENHMSSRVPWNLISLESTRFFQWWTSMEWQSLPSLWLKSLHIIIILKALKKIKRSLLVVKIYESDKTQRDVLKHPSFLFNQIQIIVPSTSYHHHYDKITLVNNIFLIESTQDHHSYNLVVICVFLNLV